MEKEEKKGENKKRILIIIAGILVVLALVFGILAICRIGKDNKHTHKYSAEWTVDSASTCTVKGSQSHHCTVEGCDAKEDITELPLADHNYVDDVCTVCGYENLSVATGLEFELSSDNTYYIVKSIGTETRSKFIIPDVYGDNNLPVKEIGSSAFKSCTNLEKVVMGDNIEKIGTAAFSYCSKLESVSIGKGASSIDSTAFDCQGEETVNGIIDRTYSSLKNIKVSEENENYKTIDGSLYTKDGLTLVRYAIGKTDTTFDIPTSVTKIGEYAFSGSDYLKNMTIPDNVTVIDGNAFFNCMNLTKVIIGNGVTDIKSKAFENCYNLVSVTLGTSIDLIWGGAFSTCYSLVEVINNSNMTMFKGDNGNGFVTKYALNIKTGGTSDIQVVDDYMFYTYDEKNYLVGYAGNETELTLPTSYNGASYEIYNYALCNRRNITKVNILSGVTNIAQGAFQRCYRLQEVTIGENISAIGTEAFYCCVSLNTVKLNSSNISIGKYTFARCGNLSKILCNFTMADWQAISKGDSWNMSTPDYIISCLDGNLNKAEVSIG